jgi:hypothetical protein
MPIPCFSGNLGYLRIPYWHQRFFSRAEAWQTTALARVMKNARTPKNQVAKLWSKDMVQNLATRRMLQQARA